MPSYSVCTPIEKGTMIQPPFKLMGVVPLLVMPRIRTSMELYGRPADNGPHEDAVSAHELSSYAGLQSEKPVLSIH